MKFAKHSWLITAAFVMCLGLFGCDLFGINSDDTADTAPDPAKTYSGVQYVIGRGYDVFDAYADPQDVRSAVLDYDALFAANEIEGEHRWRLYVGAF